MGHNRDRPTERPAPAREGSRHEHQIFSSLVPPSKPRSPNKMLRELRDAVGEAAVDVREATRHAYRRDMLPTLTLDARDNQGPGPQPLAVLRPRDEAAVARAVGVLAQHGVPIVPFGAGSGVCGGAAPLFGGVVIDLKHLDHLESVDAGALQVTCGPGLITQTLEERLNAAGYTLGHFPSSIFCASIGGCVAARGAGQLSSRYGKIEDMVTGLRVVTPDLGILTTGSMDRAGGTPDWTPLFVGSEGTLGVITSIRLRVHPLPEALVLRGIRLPSLDSGIATFREVLQSGLRPSVMRIYDPLDTWMAMQKSNDSGGAAPVPGAGSPLSGGARPLPAENAVDPKTADGSTSSTPRLLGSVVSPGTVADAVVSRFRRRTHRSVDTGGPLAGLKERLLKDRLAHLLKPENLPMDKLLANPALVNRTVDLLPGRCLAIVGCEGGEAEATEHLAAVVQAAHRLGGTDLGPGPGERWFRTRYHVSFKLPKVLQQGGFADTMETAAPWSQVRGLYDAVRRAVAPHVLVMAHLSHAYHEGCSIYFTFVGYGANIQATRTLYQRTWDAALEAVLAAGGTITHHHGVGVLKRDFMDREHGDARRLYEAARRALDSRHCMNVGKLFPDEVPPPGPPAPAVDSLALRLAPGEDGRADVGMGWRGVDLAAELALRGHFLPPLGRDFLEGTVGDWLESPAHAAHTAVHGAWEHPLLAVEGRMDGDRKWVSGRLPRSAAGPSYLPFGTAGATLPTQPVLATLRTLNPPQLRPVGLCFDHLETAVPALAHSLRGAPRPLAGMLYPGSDPNGFRSVVQDEQQARDGGIVYLCFGEPDGFPAGSQQVIRALQQAGGSLLGDDAALAWWEDHWGQAAREGSAALATTGPLQDAREIGRCTAVVPWGRAMLLLRAIETLTGGPTRASGWIEAPLETGCTIQWRFVSSRKGGSTSSLVTHQLRETLQSFGGRIAHIHFNSVDAIPDGMEPGRGTILSTADADGADVDRLGSALRATLEGALG